MNREIRDKWTAALRSGTYRQGESKLRSSDDEFCCLGVLCELAVEEGVIPQPELDGDRYVYDGGAHSYLPKSVMVWAGLDSDNARYSNAPNDLLALDNDRGVAFPQIAAIIEANF